MHLHQVVMNYVQHKHRAAARERRANETRERQRKRARHATNDIIDPDDDFDASLFSIKHDHSMKNDSLVK